MGRLTEPKVALLKFDDDRTATTEVSQMDRSRRTRRLRREVWELRHRFAQGGQGVFEQVLPTEEIMGTIEESAPVFRHRHYPPLTTLRHFIEQVLSEDQACQDVVGRRLSERVGQRQSTCSLNTSAYCQARQRLPQEMVDRLYRTTGERLETRLPKSWRWRGRRLVLFDGTTVSMPDTLASQCAFPQSAEQQPGLGFPVARLSGLIGLASGAVLGHAVSACEGKGSGEQTMLRELIPLLQAGDVLLADALLATWWIIADVTARGADVLMFQHGRRVTDFSVGETLGVRDHLVEWPRPKRPAWMNCADYESYPATLKLREAEVDNRVLVTTLPNEAQVTPRELEQLYTLRWNIEVDWRTIKVTMHMDILRCKTPEMVRKEISVHLLAYNLVRWSMASAAYLGEVLPRMLSFAGAKRLLVAFATQLRRCPGRRLAFMFATVLGAIASLTLPLRPGRVEPRAKKRRPKKLPLLTVPRRLARQQILERRMSARLNLAP